jgi:hypothetical protein
MQMMLMTVFFLFALCNLYFLFADFRPEPAIVTTKYASFACAGIEHVIRKNLSIIISWVIIFITFTNL